MSQNDEALFYPCKSDHNTEDIFFIFYFLQVRPVVPQQPGEIIPPWYQKLLLKVSFLADFQLS